MAAHIARATEFCHCWANLGYTEARASQVELVVLGQLSPEEQRFVRFVYGPERRAGIKVRITDPDPDGFISRVERLVMAQLSQ